MQRFALFRFWEEKTIIHIFQNEFRNVNCAQERIHSEMKNLLESYQHLLLNINYMNINEQQQQQNIFYTTMQPFVLYSLCNKQSFAYFPAYIFLNEFRDLNSPRKNV